MTSKASSQVLTGDQARLETDDFVRAKTDEKGYRLFFLQNGLEVLLVTDRRKTESAEEAMDEEEDAENDEDASDEEHVPGENGSIMSEEPESAADDHEDKRKGFGGCAVAMAVGVGSFHEKFGSEPHGLAHLLEHMLFMGSEKYPTENAYDDYLSMHGGFSNAFTESECTVFCEFVMRIP
jgi:nardilysin